MDRPASSAGIPLSATQKDSHPGSKTETDTPNRNDNEAPKKKPLSFKLAFIGLAAAVFVFQIDATSLGVALPVSFFELFSLSPCLTSAIILHHSGFLINLSVTWSFVDETSRTLE